MTESGGSTRLIIREEEQKNLETSVDRIDSLLTPTDSFYVRSHFAFDLNSDQLVPGRSRGHQNAS